MLYFDIHFSTIELLRKQAPERRKPPAASVTSCFCGFTAQTFFAHRKTACDTVSVPVGSNVIVLILDVSAQ